MSREWNLCQLVPVDNISISFSDKLRKVKYLYDYTLQMLVFFVSALL